MAEQVPGHSYNCALCTLLAILCLVFPTTVLLAAEVDTPGHSFKMTSCASSAPRGTSITGMLQCVACIAVVVLRRGAYICYNH